MAPGSARFETLTRAANLKPKGSCLGAIQAPSGADSEEAGDASSVDALMQPDSWRSSHVAPIGVVVLPLQRPVRVEGVEGSGDTVAVRAEVDGSVPTDRERRRVATMVCLPLQRPVRLEGQHHAVVKDRFASIDGSVRPDRRRGGDVDAAAVASMVSPFHGAIRVDHVKRVAERVHVYGSTLAD